MTIVQHKRVCLPCQEQGHRTAIRVVAVGGMSAVQWRDDTGHWQDVTGTWMDQQTAIMRAQAAFTRHQATQHK